MNHTQTPPAVLRPHSTLPAVPITVARGDGIGPEIMDATLRILAASGARLAIEEIEIGEKVYARGQSAGIERESWDSLRRTRVFLKAPITTPQGGGVKSLNVTTRKALGLYANVRPCVAHAPFVPTRHPQMDLVIIRENEEDTYAGIEHQQTDEVVQCLKLITRPGCERIVRYAFEYAVQNNRKKVSCFTKDNIMKLSDGLFHRVFDEIGAEYPQIQKEHWIVDIGAARLADTPEIFDVIVTLNLYGDILSDVAAQLTGGVGLAGSSNIGVDCAMFEAIHGSAPTLAGQDRANPSGLIHGAIAMLVHIGQPDVAERIHNAWLRTIEDGIHTEDVFRDGVSTRRVGTRAFADAVIERLGLEPRSFAPRHYAAAPQIATGTASAPRRTRARKELLGVDLFLHWDEADRSPRILGERLERLAAGLGDVRLKMISNRGVKVYPDGFPETFCTDHWRCRFVAADASGVLAGDRIVELLRAAHAAGFDVVKTENLYRFDGVRAYSLGQGE
jgi:isocitrate dehydrogenase